MEWHDLLGHKDMKYDRFDLGQPLHLYLLFDPTIVSPHVDAVMWRLTKKKLYLTYLFRSGKITSSTY